MFQVTFGESPLSNGFPPCCGDYSVHPIRTWRSIARPGSYLNRCVADSCIQWSFQCCWNLSGTVWQPKLSQSFEDWNCYTSRRSFIIMEWDSQLYSRTDRSTCHNCRLLYVRRSHCRCWSSGRKRCFRQQSLNRSSSLEQGPGVPPRENVLCSHCRTRVLEYSVMQK
jgi:hypothetical protein